MSSVTEKLQRRKKEKRTMGSLTDRSCIFYIYNTIPGTKVDMSDPKASIEKIVEGMGMRLVLKYQLPPYDTFIGLYGKYLLFRYHGEYLIATATEDPAWKEKQRLRRARESRPKKK